MTPAELAACRELDRLKAVYPILIHDNTLRAYVDESLRAAFAAGEAHERQGVIDTVAARINQLLDERGQT